MVTFPYILRRLAATARRVLTQPRNSQSRIAATTPADTQHAGLT
jgi:hypothetical protein